MNKPANVILYYGQVLFYVRTIHNDGSVLERHDYTPDGELDGSIPVMFFTEVGGAIEGDYESLDEAIAENPALLDELRAGALSFAESPRRGKASYCLAPYQVEEIHQRYTAGENISSLARDFGVSQPTIRKHIHGIARLPQNRLSEATISQIRQMYRNGSTQAVIAAKFGISAQNVTRCTQGIARPIRPKKEQRAKVRRQRQKRIDKVILAAQEQDELAKIEAVREARDEYHEKLKHRVRPFGE